MLEVPDFARLRIESRRHSLSVTAEVAFDSYIRFEPDAIAAAASCDLFSVSFIGQPNGTLPTFNVVMSGSPKDPELVLNTVRGRIERAYDDMSSGGA
jgi:hypothetical protein